MSKCGNFLFVDQEGDVYTPRMIPDLQEDIGTVGFVEFIEEDQLNVDVGMANLEASKTVLEMTSPLAGKIIKRNGAVVSQPYLLNSTNPSDNWIVQLTDVDVASYEALAD